LIVIPGFCQMMDVKPMKQIRNPSYCCSCITVWHIRSIMFDTLGTLYIILSKAVEIFFLDLLNISLFNCVNMIAIVLLSLSALLKQTGHVQTINLVTTYNQDFYYMYSYSIRRQTSYSYAKHVVLTLWQNVNTNK
jgi:hypothetical protein